MGCTCRISLMDTLAERGWPSPLAKKEVVAAVVPGQLLQWIQRSFNRNVQLPSGLACLLSTREAGSRGVVLAPGGLVVPLVVSGVT